MTRRHLCWMNEARWPTPLHTFSRNWLLNRKKFLFFILLLSSCWKIRSSLHISWSSLTLFASTYTTMKRKEGKTSLEGNYSPQNYGVKYFFQTFTLSRRFSVTNGRPVRGEAFWLLTRSSRSCSTAGIGIRDKLLGSDGSPRPLSSTTSTTTPLMSRSWDTTSQ